ncbi:type II toxin-antitoxin system HicB family antitoxin [Chitinophaga niabensis]|uniref:type II toxin-antitoxin system HicB family antitoxin n=1 Tax=Chitinophaga niabensis TaxID=536979 RepID=UPI0031BB73DF
MPKIISMTGMPGNSTYLPGILFKDDQAYYHAHVPALDITGYGITKEEAKASLQLAMKIYFERLMKERGLIKDMKLHGWMIGPHDVVPPDLLKSSLGGLEKCIESGSGVYRIGCRIKWPEGGLFG